jgi:hypothetical protein
LQESKPISIPMAVSNENGAIMHFSFWLSLAVLLLVVATALEAAIGWRKIIPLEDSVAAVPDIAPRVSIIVAALNEADTIAPALRSLLSINYPNLEIIAINDRSTDATPQIMDGLAEAQPNLRVMHIDTLPSGWLGKNHALHRGAGVASGDYLLFTDADVIFTPCAIGRAVGYCEQHRIDHLTLIFNLIANTQLLRMMLVSFNFGFLTLFKPWKVNSSPTRFCGLGGFNMVRRDVYHASGGHAAIPMAVIDDMRLGKQIKSQGYRQHVLTARQSVAVEWYRSTPEMFRGLQKNIFCSFDFSIGKLIVVTLLTLTLRAWPWVGLLVTDGATQWLNAASIVATLLMYADMLHRYGWSLRCLAFAPLVCVIELATFWSGSLSVLRRNGIIWRGTHYSLAELRRGHASLL